MSAVDEIYELLSENGQNASAITHALKVLGGDMKSGLQRIGEHFLNEGKLQGYENGEKVGTWKGVVLTLTAVILIEGAALLCVHRKKAKLLKQHEADGQEIVEILRTTIAVEDDQQKDMIVQQNSSESEVIQGPCEEENALENSV